MLENYVGNTSFIASLTSNDNLAQELGTKRRTKHMDGARIGLLDFARQGGPETKFYSPGDSCFMSSVMRGFRRLDTQSARYLYVYKTINMTVRWE